MAARLTTKQQAWVDHYKAGHTATDAARLAGYRARDDNSYQSIGSENLRKLAEYVRDREDELASPRIADMEEVNEFWTSVMRDGEQRTADRLKASELRARSAGAFLDKVEHRGEVGVKVEVSMSLADKLAAIREAAERYGH